MRRLTSHHFVHDLDKNRPPVFSINEGEQVVVETLDCHGGRVGRDGVLRPGDTRANPATGPIEVKGAQPGEALAVTLHEVRPADWGFIGGGGDASQPYTVVEMADGVARYPWGLELPLRPMVGVMGVAPPGEPVPTNTPSEYGGNLDVAEFCAGATIHFPVAVPGALLALGDVHALQGDGEVGGTGIECAAEVALSARRVAEPLSRLPYLVVGDRLMVLACAELLDDAAWQAVAEMAQVITRLTGLPDHQARQLLSTAGQLRISQIVNPKKACRAVIRREVIPDHWPF